jgi:DNA primase
MDAVDEVKQRLSIEDVISEYIPLKRTGSNWKGLSPFTNEKTASFVVSPEKQIWHDFSSNKGGDMFSFVMEVEGLDFKAALDLLARKAGIDIGHYKTSSSQNGPDKERLYQLLDLAAKFYQVHLSKNEVALKYMLEKRAFTKETALQWRLGYSPNNGSALVNFAKSKGFKGAEIKQSGLSSGAYRGGIQDMFRGRLMIPLHDAQGRVIGFTARLLEDDPEAPKYINTPQTVLYDKSRHIYGLHLAKDSIRKSKFVVITEGNLDVIASHQAGVKQVVATAGTALTEPHLKTLSRFTGDIRLCFDADRAGVAATERAIPIASHVKVSLSIIDLPIGKDPDELIKQDPKLWQKVIMDHQYALDWLLDRYSKILDIDSAQGKREFSDVLLPIVRDLTDDVERDHYLNTIARMIDVNLEALEQKFEKTTGQETAIRRRRIKITPIRPDKVVLENYKLQNNFLSLMLIRPTLREFLELIKPEMLYGEDGRQLLEFLKVNPEFDGKNGVIVQNIADYVKIESLLYEELYNGLELNELHYEAARLQARLVEQFIKSEKEKLAHALSTANDADSRALLEQVKRYDALLNKVKGAATHA